MRRERARRQTRRQRRAFLAVLIAVPLASAALLLSGGNEGTQAEASKRGERRATAPAPAPPQLPLGGRLIFPSYRIVGFYGAPQSEEFGALGIGTPASAARRLRGQAGPYARRRRPIMLAFHLLAAIAARDAGRDGKYRTRQSHEVIRRYLQAARRAKALLVLDIQPGRADFLSEVRALRRYLEEPDVGLALDPEWHMGPDEVPGQKIGSTDAATVNAVSAYVAAIVKRKNLPQKLLVVHQFTADMVRDRHLVTARPEVGLVFHADGFGSPAAKISKYDQLHGEDPFFAGLKLFYDLDRPLLSPTDVMGLSPPPDLVTYQ